MARPKRTTTSLASDKPLRAETVNDFMLGLAGSWPKDYPEENRWRDFNELFLGSEQGRRVLFAILDYCEIFKNPATRPQGLEIDDRLTYMRIGLADIGRQIIKTITERPQATPPATAQTEPDPPPKPAGSQGGNP